LINFLELKNWTINYRANNCPFSLPHSQFTKH
jgi:hypothetical protein